MKKIIFAVAIIATMMFTACNNGSTATNGSVATDSTAVDSVLVDSVSVDATVVADSVTVNQ